MKKNLFKGISFTVGASLWWGIIGVIYFKFVSYASPLELTIHRTIWTALLLILTTSYYSKWKEFNKIIKNKINILVLLLTGLLVSINWFTWLYAVSTNNLLDSALGYYIFPNLSVFLGIIFFENPIVVIEKETLSDLVVSPPDSFKSYFLQASASIFKTSLA